MSMTAVTEARPTASVMTVKCGCPGGLETKSVDINAIGITLHCPDCGGVLIAGFRDIDRAISFLTTLRDEAA